MVVALKNKKMPASRSKKSRRKAAARKSHRWVLFHAAFITILVVGAWFITGTYFGSDGPHAVENSSVNYVDPNAYKNLNIGEASKVAYSNTSIIKAKEIGISDSVDQSIFTFKVPKDNLSENGLMTLPTTPEPAGGYPVIVLCHGYANPWEYSTTKAYLGDMEFYSQNGYAVLKPDYRGQGLSLSSGSPDGAYYSMSYNTDVLSLIAAIRKTPYLNKNDINLWGHSMGAYIALRAAVLEPSIKNVILLSAPAGFIQDMYSSYTAISDAQNPTANEVKAEQLQAHGTPVTNPLYWDKVSPLTYLSRVNAHIQIHVGTNDLIVPPHFSQDLNTVLDKFNKPHSYYVYQGGKHGLIPERSAIWTRSLQLLNQTPGS
jgi:dipeptidyl aminopeptidase/acylaminoacyl peptidase